MALPRPIDTGTLARRVAALEATIRKVDASRRLSFAGAQVSDVSTGWGITTSWRTVASVSFTLPPWANQGLIMATGTAGARWEEFFLPFFMRIGVGGQFGGETAAVYGAGSEDVSTSTAWSGEVSGAGSSVPIVLQVMNEDLGQAEPPYPPRASNVATINAMVLMLR